MDQVTTAIERWQQLGLRELELPSGASVRVRLPDLPTMLRDGTMPHELEAIVLRFTLSSIKLGELTRAEVDSFAQMRDQAIVRAVEQIRLPGGEWEAVDLRPFVLSLEQILPIADLDQMGLAVLRQTPIETLNARVRVQRQALAKISGITVDDVAGPDQTNGGTPAEAPVTAGEFRDVDRERLGDAARADGAGVRAAAE